MTTRSSGLFRPRSQLPNEVHAALRSPNLTFADGLWRNPSSASWIPDQTDDLLLLLWTIANTELAGHLGFQSTALALCRYFVWSTVSYDASNFVKLCIHSLSIAGWEKDSRSLGAAFHNTTPNELPQFDYIEVASNTTGEKYVSMLPDDDSDFKGFFPLNLTSTSNAATAIIGWCAAFSFPMSLMSD